MISRPHAVRWCWRLTSAARALGLADRHPTLHPSGPRPLQQGFHFRIGGKAMLTTHVAGASLGDYWGSTDVHEQACTNERSGRQEYTATAWQQVHTLIIRHVCPKAAAHATHACK